MNSVCIVFELGDKMLTLTSMENLIVPCNLQTYRSVWHGLCFLHMFKIPKIVYCFCVWNGL